MRLLTDSYVKLTGKTVKLGKFEPINHYLDGLLGEMSVDGGLPLRFADFDEIAVSAVRAAFGDVYSANDEGYAIIVTENEIVAYADGFLAKVYTVNNLYGRYLNGGIETGIVYNLPRCPHRSARVFFPPHAQIPYFLEFLDTLVYLGYNTLMLQVSAAMEFKKHPEINEAYQKYAEDILEYNGKTYENQFSTRIRNANHAYNAHGEVYTQDETRALLEQCRLRGIDVMPEVPFLSHSDYILLAHPELAECPDEPFPDTCCPLHPDYRRIVFDLLDEVVEVFRPKTLHIGHDEWWVMCQCDRCKDHDPAELFADDVNAAYEYLKSKGVGMIMWGDKLMKATDRTGESHAGAYKNIWSVKSDRTIKILGNEYPVYEKYWGTAPEEIKKTGIHHEILATYDCAPMIDRNITMINWYWPSTDEVNDVFLRLGFPMVYGNTCPAEIAHWNERLKYGAKGFSVSSWLEMDEIHSQRWKTLFDLGYGCFLAWRHDFAEDREGFFGRVLEVADAMYRFRNRKILSGKHIEITHTSLTLADNADCGRPYVEYDDCGLGKYEISYDDGVTETVPVLFGNNIGYKYADTSLRDNPVDHWYKMDKLLAWPIAVCNYEKFDDGIWYTIALKPRDDAKVKNVKFLPRGKYYADVQIKSVKIHE